MAVAGRGSGPGRRAGWRDVVLAVGLVGAVVGGLALLVRTVWGGAYGAFGPMVLALAVAAVVAVARRVTGRGPGEGGPGGGPAGYGGGPGEVAAGYGDVPAARDGGPGAVRVPYGEGPGAVRASYADGPAVGASCVEGPEAVPADRVDGPGAVRASYGSGPGAVPPPPDGGPAPVPVLDGDAVDHEGVDPQGFEHTVAALCVRDGCTRTEVSGGPGDLGADVVATTPDGRRLVVQCKQYGPGHPVGSQDLQRFGGTCFAVHEAEVAVVVTTSTFTAPAVEYAAALGIVCVDGEALAAWTDGRTPPPWEVVAEA
ncbi:restriction endonuclease [Streptomyces thermolilacinus]|uniref:restriction endonuclease n=1 Tax=Streptomyces thermolilacinus TaxID=285540 RepID=UPI000412F2C4|nr:restriction endonuclease [Streptomyces thermolilacinus]